ncbi:MAG: LytTR family transcriptional regulator [Gammaproteobacteria bacterium]|nr:LytTR family transcriptional regulator [Gammaproteobacteria bacterium]
MHDAGPKPRHLIRHLIVWQIAIAVAVLSAIALRNAFSALSDYARLGEPLATWEPFVWEFSSVLLVAALIPAVAWLKRRLPVVNRRWYWTVPVHLLATVPFSIIHVAGMVGLRKLAYAIAGGSYHFGPILSTWVYEFRKDLVAYWLIIGFLYAFSAWRHWHKAQEVTHEPARPKNDADQLNRLVVRKLNREFILDVADIVRIESDGNYVAVHANDTTYRLRASLAGVSNRLDERRFVRIHRSQVVNIDHIREIQPWYHGDYRVLLKDGSFVNFSRRYRGRLAHLFDPSDKYHQRGAARP